MEGGSPASRHDRSNPGDMPPYTNPDSRLDCARAGFGLRSEGKNPVALLGIEPRFLGRPTRSLVDYITILSSNIYVYCLIFKSYFSFPGVKR
jgi:hypothetical protein